MSGKTDLVARVRYLLEHQAAMLESMEADLAQLQQDSPYARLRSALDKQCRQTDSLNQWQAEMEGLSAEWQAAPIPEETREAMRALASHVRKLAATTTALCDRAARIASSRAQATAAELAQLRKSRGILRQYQTPMAPRSRFIDKKT